MDLIELDQILGNNFPEIDWKELPSTAKQRAALYRLGLSRYHVKRFCSTRGAAAQAIEEMLDLQATLRRSPGKHVSKTCQQDLIERV